MHKDSRGAASTEQKSSQTMNEDHDFLTERAVDRRTRRYKQVVREEDMARREREGKKPFYLTLDADGKPYGPGRPAWVNEIRKLAAGLDPSCTDVRRQTYEAVSTFKAWLDERFEYSGTLNEDEMKSLLGKAISRKRSELYAKIDKGDPEPLHIDHAVWQRLVKLAGSRPRRMKSAQGKRQMQAAKL
jgi:hypothetical protein